MFSGIMANMTADTLKPYLSLKPKPQPQVAFV